jgi:predicted membrane-bound spermidine synthase
MDKIRIKIINLFTWESKTQGGKKTVIAALAFSGAAALIYEVAATQGLLYFFNSSTNSFSTVLVSFLSGLALGSFLLGKYLDKIKNRFYFLGILQIAASLYAMVVLIHYDLVAQIFYNLAGAFGGNYLLTVGAKFLASLLFLLFPTLMLGASFPLASAILVDSPDQAGKIISRLYFWDLFGAVVGSLLVGFFLIPFWGLANSIIFGSLLNFLAAFMILFKNNKKTLAASIIIIAAAFNGNLSSMRNKDTILKKENGQIIGASSQEILYQKNSPYGEVSVAYQSEKTTLYIDRNPQCTTNDYSQTDNISSVLNMVKENGEALDIGLGCGNASRIIHEASNISHLDIVEINPQVKEATKYFNNYYIFDSPKVAFYLDDVRHYLEKNGKKYDFINSDLNVASLSNISPFYTLEYFNLLKGSMNGGGALRIWAISGNYEYAKIFYKTLKKVFPVVEIKFSSNQNGDIIGLEFMAGEREFIRQSQEEKDLQKEIENDSNFQISTLDNQAIGNAWHQWNENKGFYYEK